MANDPAYDILRGVKLDLLSKPPMFGIPIIGHALNIPEQFAGLVTSQIPALTPEGSPALEVARTQGVGAAFEQREDLSDVEKMAIEFGGAQAIPGFAITGPAGGATRAITSPAVSGIKAVERAGSNIPLFKPSSRAVVQTAKEDAGSLLEYMKRRNIAPEQFTGTLDDFNAGRINSQQAAANLQLAPSQFEQLAKYTKTFAKPQSLGSENGVYDAAMKLIEKNTAESVGFKPTRNPTARLYQGANQIVRETGMSGGTTWIANFMDMISKAMLEGIGAHKFVNNLHSFIRNGGKLDDYDNIVGDLPLDGRLGINKSAIVGLDADTQRALLDRLGPINAALIGGGLGALTGNPLAAIAGALGGGLTVLGFKANRALMTLGEAVGRETYFIKGYDNFIAKNADNIGQMFVQAIGPQKGTALNNVLKAEGYHISPEKLAQIAPQFGLTGDEIGRSVQAWRTIHAPAVEAGVGFSNNIAFNYTRDSNLTQAMRQYTPYPVWPIHNIPYYAEKAVQYPLIPALVGDYVENTDRQSEEGGLPQRLDHRVPLADTGGGTAYFNPLSPLSITTQLTEPYPAAPGTEPTILDKASDILSIVGLSPTTPLQWAGQVTGLLDQQRDFQDFFPATRLLRPAGQALLGENVDPEGAIKAGLEGVRANAAPQASPKVPYQEYLVRKKLAEMALRDTGKAWFQTDEYARAMIEDNNPLWQRAVNEVGQEQANLYVSRRLFPAQVAYISDEERNIRQANKDMGQLPDNLAGADYGRIMDENPWAFGYKDISDSEAVLNLEVKQNLYYRLPQGTARTIFRKENPDFAAYLKWYGIQKDMGNKPKIEDYVNQIGVQ